MEIKSISYKSERTPFWTEEEPNILHPHPFETIYQIPKGLGEGTIQSIQIRDGMDLILVDQKPDRDLVLEITVSPELTKLFFTLSGQMKAIFPGSNQHYIIPAGERTLGVFGPKMNVVFSRDQPTQVACISFENHLLQSLEGESQVILDKVSQMIQKTLTGMDRPSNPIDSAMLLVLHQIQNCPYQDSLRQVYLESKVLELLVLCSEQSSSIKPNGHSQLHAQDIDKIHYAKEILLENMETPPSLLELAKQVGINDFKLKKGFREILGTTVFGFLREQRMEKARLLLEEGKMNVTEVLYDVGYNSPSHFTFEFKKRFGITPSSLIN